MQPDPIGSVRLEIDLFRGQSFLARPGARSRCMHCMQSTLGGSVSASEPLLLDGNLRRGRATVSVVNHDRNPGDGHNLAQTPYSCR